MVIKIVGYFTENLLYESPLKSYAQLVKLMHLFAKVSHLFAKVICLFRENFFTYHNTFSMCVTVLGEKGVFDYATYIFAVIQV